MVVVVLLLVLLLLPLPLPLPLLLVVHVFLPSICAPPIVHIAAPGDYAKAVLEVAAEQAEAGVPCHSVDILTAMLESNGSSTSEDEWGEFLSDGRSSYRHFLPNPPSCSQTSLFPIAQASTLPPRGMNSCLIR
jgi:hypothetical protein